MLGAIKIIVCSFIGCALAGALFQTLLVLYLGGYSE